MKVSESHPETDGRKQRTNQSRLKIVNAMLQLIRQGYVSPSAEQVAEQAGVGLRTVFRRFNEMELLFREISCEISRVISPKISEPILGDTWQEKLDGLIDRKIAIYQAILPYRVAAKYHMHSSQFIQEDQSYWAKFEKKVLESILPISEKEDFSTFHGINACISFENWHALTSVQGLSNKKAKAVIQHSVSCLSHHLD